VSAADPGSGGASSNGRGGTVLVFLNEVAGGRRLLEATRERVAGGVAEIALVAPQNQPIAGQIVDRDEVLEAAQSRVEVTQAVFSEYGIESIGAVMDPDSALALDDAIRAFTPREVLLSCLYETRFGFARKDLVEWAKQRFDVPITHIPVRIEDDAIRWDVTHTLVVATRTVASEELISRLLSKAADRPHRYTIVSPPSGGITREEVCQRLARTLAEMYRSDVDATGQPMSPAPLAAVQNALEHYRIDEILISTLRGERSKWVEEGLLDSVGSLTEKSVEHVEAGDDVIDRSAPERTDAPVAVGAERDEEGSVATAGGGGTSGGTAAGEERSG
jgi:hypothetical protein